MKAPDGRQLSTQVFGDPDGKPAVLHRLGVQRPVTDEQFRRTYWRFSGT